VIELRGSEIELGRRKRKSDVMRRSAGARNLEKLGASTTQRGGARRVGRRKTGQVREGLEEDHKDPSHVENSQTSRRTSPAFF
jgi:hypothetical protein